jgi:release factor glutamine methyltransferase
VLLVRPAYVHTNDIMVPDAKHHRPSKSIMTRFLFLPLLIHLKPIEHISMMFSLPKAANSSMGHSSRIISRNGANTPIATCGRLWGRHNDNNNHHHTPLHRRQYHHTRNTNLASLARATPRVDRLAASAYVFAFDASASSSDDGRESRIPPPSSRCGSIPPPPPSRRAASSLSSAEDVDGDATTRRRALPPSYGISGGISINDAMRSSLRLLEDLNIPEPNESVVHLLSHALNLDWDVGHRRLREVFTLPHPLPYDYSPILPVDRSIYDLAKQILSSEQRIAYLSLLERRMRYEPLQYILGRWDFHHLSGLRIRRPMLCPRPETEELVELVLADIDRLIDIAKIEGGGNRRIRILDVGCGTGAIGIAIARRYPRHVRVVALDVSPDAVDLSNENAALFLSGGADDHVDVRADISGLYTAIVCSARDFTNEGMQSEAAYATERKWEMDFDIVVSNPPYIPTRDMLGLSWDVTGFESHGALCGGDDGLNVIRDIVYRLPEWLSPTITVDDHRRVQRHCWMEVDDSHPTKLEKWLAPGSKESVLMGVEYCDRRKDFCGRDRFVKLIKRCS